MPTDPAGSPDWKLRLRYGKLVTPFRHFTALAEGRMNMPDNDFGCPVGPAWMTIKTWATDADESADMIRAIGSDIGFELTGRIQIYDTDPEQEPQQNPFGYGIGFTPFTEE